MLLTKLLLALLIGVSSAQEERYQPDQEPPETGWKSAVKYFLKDSSKRSPQSDDDAGYKASGDRLLFLDSVAFLDNRLGTDRDTPGKWGLNLGFEWDKSWFGQGIYVQHTDYDLEKKFAVLGGLIFPTLASQFPLYLKANVGLGYFVGNFSNDTLTVDYNIHTGFRYFTRSGFLFNIEMGSRNYSRLLTKSYMNSWVVSSGLAFLF